MALTESDCFSLLLRRGEPTGQPRGRVDVELQMKRGQAGLPLSPPGPTPQEVESSQPGARSSSPSQRRAGCFTAADGKWPDWPRNLRSPRAGSSHVSMVVSPVRDPAFLMGKTCPARPRDPGR